METVQEASLPRNEYLAYKRDTKNIGGDITLCSKQDISSTYSQTTSAEENMEIETNPYVADDTTYNSKTSMSTDEAIEEDNTSESSTTELPTLTSPKRVSWGDEQNQITLVEQTNIPKWVVSENPKNKYSTTQSLKEKEKKIMKERGVRMSEKKKRLITPTKLEFNLEANNKDFDIVGKTYTLLDMLKKQDQSIKITNTEQNIVIYEEGLDTIENEEFKKQFKVRERIFRKGTQKILLYFTIESTETINRLKFASPIKQYLLDNNIWLKPDLFFTKIESSPGFFTLVHPRMTNKDDFKNEIEIALGHTNIDNTDTVVKRWRKHNKMEDKQSEKGVPLFHVETSLRKWGHIQVEVIKITCMEEDTEYMKYLLSTASSQNKIQRGLFVPTGIQLMETKEILTNLLEEHKQYTESVTSYQIEGIGYHDMYEKQNIEQETIKELLQKCEGIVSVERTYHTALKGQWLLIIKQKEQQKVTNYINDNLGKIYQKKKEKKTRLITFTKNTSTKAYKLQVSTQYGGNIGTYAEVLKRRFENTNDVAEEETTKNSHKVSTLTHKTNERGIVENNMTETKPSDTHVNLAEFPSLPTKNRTNKNVQEKQLAVLEERTHITGENEEIKNNRGDSSMFKQNIRTAMEIELQQMKKSNESLLEKFKQEMETKVEELLEKRTMEVSILVANTVAGKLTEAIKTMLHRKLSIPSIETQLSLEGETRTPPQVSPIKTSNNQRIQPDPHMELLDTAETN